MLAGRDCVIISSIDWDFLWQGPQEIASRLALSGNRVLYVENTGVRGPKLRDARRVACRLINWTKALSQRGVRPVAPNLYVCSPLVLPPFGSQLDRELNRRVFLSLIRSAVARLQMRDIVLITFLPTDTVLDLTKLLHHRTKTVVYYCVADFAELTAQPEQLNQSEQELAVSSNLILAACSALAAHCSKWAENIHIIPYGVNLEVFSPANGTGSSRKVENQDKGFELSRPIIGYIGGLHKYVDLALLSSMARARPQWSWVFVGPEQMSIGQFASIPNVYLLGEFKHQELARHVETFDVGIVPYVQNAFTNTVVPTKINEYLAMGKPVVSTALPAVTDHYRWPDIVLSCEPRHDSFIAGIEKALLLPTDEAAKARRREIAAISDWQARMDLICNLIETSEAKSSTQFQTKFAHSGSKV